MSDAHASESGESESGESESGESESGESESGESESGESESGESESIEPLITRLVQQAPALEPHTVAALLAALEDVGTDAHADAHTTRGLARSIARIVELVADHLVDPGIALPALAEACATLVAGVDGRLDARVLEAARYQIDTLQPVPDRPVIAVPDVPISLLRRRP